MEGVKRFREERELEGSEDDEELDTDLIEKRQAKIQEDAEKILADFSRDAKALREKLAKAVWEAFCKERPRPDGETSGLGEYIFGRMIRDFEILPEEDAETFYECERWNKYHPKA